MTLVSELKQPPGGKPMPQAVELALLHLDKDVSRMVLINVLYGPVESNLLKYVESAGSYIDTLTI